MDNSEKTIRERFADWKNDHEREILEKLEQYFNDSNTADSYQSYSIASPEGILKVIRPYLEMDPDIFMRNKDAEE